MNIFVGVDCFGRGCPGGGGFNTKEAIELILQASVSQLEISATPCGVLSIYLLLGISSRPPLISGPLRPSMAL